MLYQSSHRTFLPGAEISGCQVTKCNFIWPLLYSWKSPWWKSRAMTSKITAEIALCCAIMSEHTSNVQAEGTDLRPDIVWWDLREVSVLGTTHCLLQGRLPSIWTLFGLNADKTLFLLIANLAIWRRSKNLSDASKLCGQKQTLAHVLNQCPVALHLCRYNIRGDAVLQVIETNHWVCKNHCRTFMTTSHNHSHIPSLPKLPTLTSTQTLSSGTPKLSRCALSS